MIRIREISDFGRLTAAGLGLSCVVIGYASVAQQPAPRLLALLAVGLAFHIVAFALNDVFDLEIDRTNADRGRSPLVAERISVRGALAIIAAIFLVSLLIDIGVLGLSLTALAVLLFGYACLACYDVFTKRTGVPILTDLVQGVGWACLVGYGALRANPGSGGELSGTTAIGALFVIGFVVMVNGVHGGLRDLANDVAHGSRTTAIQLGARIDSRGRLVVPPRLRGYAWALQIGLAILAMVGIVTVAPDARSTEAWAWYAAAVVTSLGALATLRQAMLSTGELARFLHIGANHILVCYLPVICLAGMSGGSALGLLTAAVMVVPMLGNEAFRAAFAAAPRIVATALHPTPAATAQGSPESTNARHRTSLVPKVSDRDPS